MSKPFQFKEFSVNQNRCAMKIGTDSVLLGAWVDLAHNPFSILDIGAGTGVLSLMLAQRSQAQVIDAIEIDEHAYEQCVENFETSQWADRLFCYHASLNEFTEEIDDKYDLIISNPPFYSDAYKSKDSQRDLARFTDAMPFEHLINSAAYLLSENGTLNVIIPFKEESKCIKLAANSKLYPNQISHVKGTPTSDIKRSLISLSFHKTSITQTVIVIEIARHQYTPEYIKLTKDFYLKM